MSSENRRKAEETGIKSNKARSGPERGVEEARRPHEELTIGEKKRRSDERAIKQQQ